ncbi:D-alanyl-D-alanine carboxypeptidase [Alicyclobacillus curvatus]|nr:D-alanyl-D-alanine carboxypeptidase [Alicyclobacillus curvatus]
MNFPTAHASTVSAHPLLSGYALSVTRALPPNVEFHVTSEKDDTGDQSPHLAAEARSAVVMDFSTGKVLFEKDAHEKLPLASVTKVMTLLLIMEALDNGQVHLTDKVKTSEHAAKMGGSQVFLEPGETMTVNDLLKAIAMASANDACASMAEYLAGTESQFVQKMNQRAKQLGMDDTHFVNSNGLPETNHYSSAHDIAIMSRELLKHEEITKYTSKYSDYLRKDTEHPFWLVNTNKLVRFYDGVDGLKTGFTSASKYCLSATAKRDGFRVIAVVMGEPKSTVRNKEVSELLNWAFAEYQSRVLYPAGATVQEIEIPHGTPEEVTVRTADTLGVVMHKGEKADFKTSIKLNKNLHPPLKQGDVVGKITVSRDGEDVASVPLVVAQDVRKAGFFQAFGRTVRKMVTFGQA